ncbi:MAG: hypothetical protein HFG93_00095 [Dorea sp.]|nr:hypothetical protein [Dorea sp.]
MRRSDYLNPADLKSQCTGAVRRMEEDMLVLEAVGRGIDTFAGDPEIESESFDALKQQLADYHMVIEAMKLANQSDMADFRCLSDSAGSEVLDGERLFDQMENALRMRESYLTNEETYKSKMKMAKEPALTVYYQWKARQYGALAKNSESLYERWRRKTERFDEIEAWTGGLFKDSEGITALIRKGMTEISGAFQNGTYVQREDDEWRRQIMNAGVRLAMGFEDEGGDQNAPYRLWQRGFDSDRAYMRELIHSYEEYADYTDEEIEELLMKLNSEGCGYVAFANIIVDEYRRKDEEFKQIFGYPLFLENVNGYTYVDYNRLILDIYCAVDNHKKVKNLWQEYDIYDENEDISPVSGRGTTPEDRIYRFERYMDSHDVPVRIENIECAPDEVYQRCREEAERGNRVIISTCPVRLEDKEGEPAQMDGGHAMTVTGLTSDGRIEVSSWGEKYYISPEDPDYTSPEKSRTQNAYIRIQSVRFGEADE